MISLIQGHGDASVFTRLHPWRGGGLWLFFFVASVFLVLLFPADIPFINDEPELIRRALLANEDGRLELLGLIGTAGIRYGPTPTWFYQVALHFTHHLPNIVLIKASIATALLFFVMLALVRQLRLTHWGIIVALLSPFAFLYHRMLWDFGFMVPLTALLLYFLVKLTRTSRPIYLWLATGLGVWLLYTQMKILFVVIAFALTLALLKPQWLWKHRIHVFGAGAIGLLLLAPYMRYCIHNVQLGTGNPATGIAVWAPLIVFTWTTYQHWLSHYLPEMWISPPFLPAHVFQLLVWLTGIAWIFAGIGLVRSFRHLRKLRFGRPTAHQTASVFAISLLVITLIFQALTRRQFYLHYHTPIWISGFYFVWLGMDACWRRGSVSRVLVLTHASALLLVLALAVTHIHQTQGNRTIFYGPSLRTQLAAGRIVRNYRNPHIAITVGNWRRFPHAYHVLQQILARQQHRSPPFDEAWLIIQHTEPQGQSGHLHVAVRHEPFDLFLPITTPEDDHDTDPQ